MYRLAVSLGHVQTALPNCYGCDHQGSHAGRVYCRVKGRGAQGLTYDVVYDKFMGR